MHDCMITPNEFENMIPHIDDVNLQVLMFLVHRMWKFLLIWREEQAKDTSVEEMVTILEQCYKTAEELTHIFNQPQNDAHLKTALDKFLHGVKHEIDFMDVCIANLYVIEKTKDKQLETLVKQLGKIKIPELV